MVQAIHEQDPIRNSRERFVQRVVQQALLGRLAARDVGLRAGYPERTVIVVTNGESATQRPTILSVGMTDAVLTFEMLRLSPKMRIQRLVQSLTIQRMDAPEPLVGAVFDLPVATAEDRFPAR